MFIHFKRLYTVGYMFKRVYAFGKMRIQVLNYVKKVGNQFHRDKFWWKNYCYKNNFQFLDEINPKMGDFLPLPPFFIKKIRVSQLVE